MNNQEFINLIKCMEYHKEFIIKINKYKQLKIHKEHDYSNWKTTIPDMLIIHVINHKIIETYTKIVLKPNSEDPLKKAIFQTENFVKDYMNFDKFIEILSTKIEEEILKIL